MRSLKNTRSYYKSKMIYPYFLILNFTLNKKFIKPYISCVIYFFQALLNKYPVFIYKINNITNCSYCKKLNKFKRFFFTYSKLFI